jgi:hypothetical protein
MTTAIVGFDDNDIYIQLLGSFQTKSCLAFLDLSIIRIQLKLSANFLYMYTIYMRVRQYQEISKIHK